MDKIMKFNRIISFALAISAIAGLSSCEEFGPVFTGKYDEPEPSKIYTDADFEGLTLVDIADLKARYTAGQPFNIEEDIYIKGQVNSSDSLGNFYRSFYIQDKTGGIEIKAGKTGLYNSYKRNQWVYVKCKGLALGAYGGMVQLGYESMDPQYETSYIDVQLLIDNHIFRGEMGEKIEPIVVTDGQDILDMKYLGMLCTVQGLAYGDEVFAIFHDSADNNIYIGDDYPNGAHGITTWALSETGCATYIEENKDRISALSAAIPESISVSQYFTLGNATLQVRTSGYSRFADTPLTGDPEKGVPDVTKGSNVSLTGIMTIHNDNFQITLNDLSGVQVEE